MTNVDRPIAWDTNIATVYGIPSLEETAAAQSAITWIDFDDNECGSISIDQQVSISSVTSAKPRSTSKSLRFTCEVYGRALRQAKTLDAVCNLKGDPDYQSIYVKEVTSPSASSAENFGSTTSIVTTWNQWVKSPFPSKPIFASAVVATQIVQNVVPSSPDVSTLSTQIPDPVAVQHVVRGFWTLLLLTYAVIYTSLAHVDFIFQLMLNLFLRCINHLHWTLAVEAEGEEWGLSCPGFKGNAPLCR